MESFPLKNKKNKNKNVYVSVCLKTTPQKTWTVTSFSLFRMFLSLFMIATSDHVERHAAHFKTGENHNNLFTITTHPKHAARYFSVCDERLS